MPEPERVEIRLEPNGVVTPAKLAAINATEVVSLCLRAFDDVELAIPERQGQTFALQFSRDPEPTTEERRSFYKSWVLARGLQDLIRGINETLQEAVLYIEVLKWAPRSTTLAAIESEIGDIKLRANGLHFPALLAMVNRGLTLPLSFDSEFLSLNRARNCLEHRRGIVSEKDVDDGSTTMTLTYPAIKTYYIRNGEEISLAIGEVIDTFEPGVRGPDGHVSIFAKRENRTINYNIGDRLTISASEFYELAMACLFFADDLGSKLPTKVGSI
jgi:hypothetical protein